MVAGWTCRSCAAAGVAAPQTAPRPTIRTTTARVELDVVVTASSACKSSSASTCLWDASRGWRRAGSDCPCGTRPHPRANRLRCRSIQCAGDKARTGCRPGDRRGGERAHARAQVIARQHRQANGGIQRCSSLDRHDERSGGGGHLGHEVGVAVGEGHPGARERQARETVDGHGERGGPRLGEHTPSRRHDRHCQRDDDHMDCESDRRRHGAR